MVPMRERILRTSAELISEKGYHATTTRMIADKLKIQQPSLFHHFPSKAAIVSALLAWDLDTQLPIVQKLASEKNRSALERMKEYLLSDLNHVMNSPYNLAGVFGSSVMSDPQFSEWRAKRLELRDGVAQIIEDGIQSGEFIEVNPHLAAEMVAGVILSMLTEYGGRQLEPNTDIFATSRIVLRGLLVTPEKADGQFKEESI
jgi:AcrR family transcriptional regulator